MPHGWLDGTPAHSRLPVSLEPEPTHTVALPLTIFIKGTGPTLEAATINASDLRDRVRALVEASTRHCYGSSVEIKEDVLG